MEYLNRGVPTSDVCIYRRGVTPRSPPLVAPPYAGTQEISVPLPSLGPGIWLVLCRQVRKRVPARQKKKSPLWRSSPGWVHQDARPRVLTATSCPHSLLCLTEGLKLFTDSGHKQLSMQQGCEPNRDGALSLPIDGQWRGGWPLRSWAGQARGLRETRQHF